MDTEKIDVNVHPSKMEVRIADGPAFYEEVRSAVEEALRGREMIPEVSLFSEKEQREEAKEEERQEAEARQNAPEPFESRRITQSRVALEGQGKSYVNYETPSRKATQESILRQNLNYGAAEAAKMPEQMAMFDDRLLSAKAREQYEIIGQLFETYWLISCQDKLMIVDQHAAHEKVRYERLMRHFREKDIVSQTINPPVIVTLSNREKECFLQHEEDFASLGFEIEAFGGNDYAVRGVPMDLYGYTEESFFYEILDELAGEGAAGTPEGIRTRIATMACKAAVKGNMRMSRQEMEALVDELLTLDNPYNCPHGRPTIVSMSKNEIEKKFKRIV